VTLRTREKDQLIREINHRIGNQLQILSSIVSIEMRRTPGPEARDILGRLRGELDKMGKQHRERSMHDYLALDTSGKLITHETPAPSHRVPDRRVDDECGEQDQPGIAVRLEQAQA